MANRYLTLGHNLTPYITTYKVTNDAAPTFTKISDPATLPPGDVYDVRWNNSATSLAVASFDASPFVSIYNVADDVLTRIATFTGLTTSVAVAWNHDGSKIALGDSASPYIRIYNRSGDTFTLISDPASLPTGAVNDIAWSVDGQKLALAHNESPYLTVYTVSGDTFTKVADPALTLGFNGQSVAWNFSGNALAVGGSSTGINGKVYNFLSNTLSHAANIGPIGTLAPLGRNTIAWRPINDQVATRIIVYDRSGNTYSNTGANITTTDVTSVSWDNTGNIFSIGSSTSTFIRNFSQVTSNGFAQLSNLSSAPTSTVRSISWGYGGVTQTANAAITSQVSLSSSARISTQSGRATLSTVSTLRARVLGDINYVDEGYIDLDYFIVGSDFEYFEPDYIQDGYVEQPFVTATVSTTSAFSFTAATVKLRQQSANINTTLSLASAGDRIRYGVASITSTATITSVVSRTRSADASLLAFNTTLTVGDRTRSAEAQLASAFTQSATANYNLSPAISLTSTATVSASMSVLKPADASLSAFNTVLSAVGRIRSLGSDMTVTTTFSATPIKIRTAATNNNLKTINPTPYTGIYVDRTDHYATLDDEEYLSGGILRQASTQAEWLRDATFSFWARCDDGTGGTVFSSEGPAGNFENMFTVSLNPQNLIITHNYSAGETANQYYFANLDAVDILPGEWHHYFIQIDQTIQQTPAPYTAKVWVDGSLILDESGSRVIRPIFEAVNPIAIGARRRPGLVLDQRFKGAIVQLWITDNVTDSIGEFYDATNPITPFVDLGTTGRKADNSLTQPVWYEQFNYPFTNDVVGRPLLDDNQTAEEPNDVEAIDTDYLPDPGNQPIIGRFTFSSIGDRTVFADAFSANSVASLTGTASYNKPATANLTVSTAFTANSYDFTKATVALSSTATVTAITDRIRYADVNINSALSATLIASDKNTGLATMASEFTLTADPTTNLLGIVSAQAAFNFSATAYDFTKAQVSLNAQFALEVEGRYQARTRANAEITSTATLTSIPSRTRPGQTTLTTVGSLLIADGGALRRGNIAMSAFNTVLTAGKLIEFYAENTFKVTQELGLLHVYDDVESNVLLVEDAQELNKIYVDDGLETTKIYPEQETGVLLAQHRQPTF